MAQKQIVVTVSDEAQSFINLLCTSYQGAGVTKQTDLTQREAVDALIAFASEHRFATVEVEATDPETGELLLDAETGAPIMETVPFGPDRFELEIKRTLALRDVTSKASVSKAKLADKEKEIAELKALLAKLTAAKGEATPEA